MSKRSLLYALEGVADELEGYTEGELREMRLNSMLAENELIVADLELIQVERDSDELEASLERLLGIAKAIEKHGICRPMMEAADPDGELVIAGLCCDYEHLSIEPEHNTHAKSTIEGIRQAASDFVNRGATPDEKANRLGIVVGVSIYAIIIGSLYLYAIGHWFTGFISGLMKRSKFHIAECQRVEKQLSFITSIDESKFKETKATVLSRENYKRAISAGTELVNVVDGGTIVKFAADLEKLASSDTINAETIDATIAKAKNYLKQLDENADIRAITGISFDFDKRGNVETVVKTKVIIEEQHGSLGELGWNSGDAKAAVLSGHKLASIISNSEKNMEHVVPIINYTVASIKKISNTKKFTKEDGEVVKRAFKEIELLIKANKEISRLIGDALRNVAGTSVTVGKAVIKAGTMKS